MPASARTEIEHEIGPPTPPGPGLERAQLRGIPWCGGVHERDPEWWMHIVDDLHQYRTSRHYEGRLFRLARGVCSEPDDPLAQRVATEVLQLWINESGMAARDAVESLAARSDKDTFQAERTALCDAIKPKGDDSRKERTALAAARFLLLGCKREDPLWMFADEVEHLGPIAARPRATTSPTWRGCCTASTGSWSRATATRSRDMRSISSIFMRCPPTPRSASSTPRRSAAAGTPG
jgi:hypothetical protein